jgi:transcriptional/translational regulatory protein YebC/TACO1
MTDNRNRTVGEVRHIFSKHGGNLGTDGSVAYLFSKIGLFVFAPGVDEEKVMEVSVGAGADDVETADDGSIEVLTAPEQFDDVLAALTQAGLSPDVAEVVERPSNETSVIGEDAEKVMRLIDALEELDDVQDVFTNATFEEEAARAE